MTFEEIKFKVDTFHNNGQTINAFYWLLEHYELKNENLKEITFREIANPEFILLTTEGNFGEEQIIRIPENIFQFPLALIITMIVHELIHVDQKALKPYVLDKNEREWQAYYEMIFHKKYPNIPEISTYHKKFFANKGLEYYNRMEKNSEIQLKYASQKKEMDDFILSLE